LSVPSRDRLSRWEDRALLGCFLVGACNASYALEQPLLILPLVVGVLVYPWIKTLRKIASPLTETVVLLVTGLAAIPIGVAAREPAPALALFLIAAQGLKCLMARTERDKATSAVVGIALAAVAAAEAVEPVIAPLLFLSVAFTLAFAAIRNLRLHGKTDGSPGPTWTGQLFHPRAVLSSLWLVFLVGLGTTVFFFVCPRVGAKLFANHQLASSERLAGFSDAVALDSIGKIKQNDRTAFRVVLEEQGAVKENPYWRGRALDTYDGKRWRASRALNYTVRPFVQEAAMVFRDRRVVAEAGKEPTRLTFYVEPLGTRCLFTTGNALRVTFKSARPHALKRDDLGSVLMDRAYRSPVAYELDTFIGDAGSKTLLSTHRERFVRKSCLTLPPNVDRERLRQYARRALRDRRVPEGGGSLRAAGALAAHLRQRYTYSLDVESTGRGEKVQEFLYTSRKGHCELFASAHVFLLRAQGIPARLVTGFHGGEWNEWSSSYTLRQRDAHAWVEAYTEDGWRTFDPTPADPSAGNASQFLDGVKSVADWLELRWFSLVIAFDAYDQWNFVNTMRERFTDRFGDSSGAVRPGAGGVAAALSGLVLVVGFGAFAARRRQRRVHALQRSQAVATDEGLAALLRALDRRDYRLQPAETPLELATRAGGGLGLDERLNRWVLGYYARRYGRQSVEGPENERLQEILAALEAGRREAGPV
jgi:protein-glutamine gamma-glutamyltransferase